MEKIMMSYTPMYNRHGVLAGWKCDYCKGTIRLWDRNRHLCPEVDYEQSTETKPDDR